MNEPLLVVNNLCKYFPLYSQGFFSRAIGHVKAVDHVSFEVMTGETLGLVGESGCGKTTTVRTILCALAPSSGQVLFRAFQTTFDLAAMPQAELKVLRTKMQMIFQDPFSSLNPRMTVGDIVEEPLIIHNISTPRQRKERVVDIVGKVGLKPEHLNRYPHAFSGGQRQRIGVARALILHPSLVVADEAVSALDVSVQAQVINLLEDLQQALKLTYIFVAHDLSVVKHICDRVAVMYAGKIVELASTDDLFEKPLHPYTRTLMSAVPYPDPDTKMDFNIRGEVADPAHLPPGCSFHPRCPQRMDICTREVPEICDIGDGRTTACHLYTKGNLKSLAGEIT